MDCSKTPVGANFSPVTGLAMDLGGLSTTGYVATPRRRISWSNVCGDSPATLTASDDDIDLGSENLNISNYCSPTKVKAGHHLKSLILGSPGNKENVKSGDEIVLETPDGLSQDSGYCSTMMDKEMSGHDSDYYSMLLSQSSRTSSLGSPARIRCRGSLRDRCLSSSSWIGDDEVLALQDQNFNEETQFPAGISTLMESPLCFRDVTNIIQDSSMPFHQADGTPARPSQCNRITERHTFKRPEPPLKETHPNQQKRRRKALSLCESPNPSPMNILPMISEVPLPDCFQQRSYSESHTTIMKAVNRSCQDPSLIGDFSRSYALPLIKGKHQDLRTISTLTAMNVLTGKYCGMVKQHTIVDCRYPYEYGGGHIQNAKNIYTKEGIINEFLNCPPKHNVEDPPSILIFHCEFSSERGPSLMRFLRNKDREVNHACYPALHYPEIYLLEGGYKAFYEAYSSLCQPQAYIPMLHKDHECELKSFRAKSKSWGTDAKRMKRPGLKF